MLNTELPYTLTPDSNVFIVVPEAELCTFYASGSVAPGRYEEYSEYFYYGMTWEEWINSDLNVSGFHVSDIISVDGSSVIGQEIGTPGIGHIGEDPSSLIIPWTHNNGHIYQSHHYKVGKPTLGSTNPT